MKIFLVTRISGNNSIFLFGHSEKITKSHYIAKKISLLSFSVNWFSVSYYNRQLVFKSFFTYKMQDKLRCMQHKYHGIAAQSCFRYYMMLKTENYTVHVRIL